METEIKILEIDVDDVIERLETLEAERVFDDVMRAVYFDTDGSLDARGVVLRARSEGEQAVISVKARIEDATYKRMHEYEFAGRFDDAIAALQLLGFEPKHRQEKHRTSYRFESVRIDIDRYLGDDSIIPPFLEIEGEPDAIEQAIRRLGLDRYRRVNWGGGRLREHYESTSRA